MNLFHDVACNNIVRFERRNKKSIIDILLYYSFLFLGMVLSSTQYYVQYYIIL